MNMIQKKRLAELKTLQNSGELSAEELGELKALETIEQKDNEQVVQVKKGDLKEVAKDQAESIIKSAVEPLAESVKSMESSVKKFAGMIKSEYRDPQIKKDFVEMVKNLDKIKSGAMDASHFKALNMTVEADGGVLINREVEAEIIQYLEDYGLARQVCDVRAVSSRSGKANTFGSGSVAKFIDEATKIGETQPVFGEILYNLKKLGAIGIVSSELDSEDPRAFDYLVQDIASAIAHREDFVFLNGTGASDDLNGGFTGVLNLAGAQNIAGDAGQTTFSEAINYDKITEMVYSIDAKFKQDGKLGWIANDNILAYVETIKDANSRPLYNDLKTSGVPTLKGFPVFRSSLAPITDGAGQPSLIFGNLQAFGMRALGSIRIKKSEEYKFDTDEIAVRMLEDVAFFSKADGAFSVLKNAAS